MAKRTPLLTALLYQHCAILGLGVLEDQKGGSKKMGKRRLLHFTLQVPGQGMAGERVKAVFSRVPLCAFDQTMPRPPFCGKLQGQQVKG